MKTVIITIIVLGVIGAAWVLLTATPDKSGSGNTAVPIEAEYEGRIVYTTDAGADPAPLREHCEAQGGTFEDCGSPCAPEAETCVSVCAYTCEMSP